MINPFEIPSHWQVVRGFDFGYAKPFSVGWYAVDEKGVMYRIAEYYGCTGTPNEGIKITPQEIAANIREMGADTSAIERQGDLRHSRPVYL